VYLPAAQSVESNVVFAPKDLVVRLSRPGLAPVAAIREIVRRVDSEQPLSNVRMMSEVVDGETATRRAQLRVLGALASLALLLAAVGIHGLLAFTVAQRSRELGVRLALGAPPASIARMIVLEAARMAIVGVVPGLLAGYAAARAMSSLLFDIGPADPITFAAAASLCFAAAVLGCLRPAVRAARTDPISALRAD